jgi:thiamine-phosphate pyrophosphorylase
MRLLNRNKRKEVLKLNFDGKLLRLYAVTDRIRLQNMTLCQAVEQAILGGATLVQLREKELEFSQFVQTAIEVKQVTERYHVPLIINDNVQVAKECDAAGVHVGQKDMPPLEVRQLLGEDKIVGVSARTVEQAKRAEQSGADYLGVGAVFPTATKLDAKAMPPALLTEICSSVSIPVVAIGGINESNALKLKGTGVDGIAVVSALFAKEDIRQAAKGLLALSQEITK